MPTSQEARQHLIKRVGGLGIEPRTRRLEAAITSVGP